MATRSIAKKRKPVMKLTEQDSQALGQIRAYLRTANVRVAHVQDLPGVDIDAILRLIEAGKIQRNGSYIRIGGVTSLSTVGPSTPRPDGRSALAYLNGIDECPECHGVGKVYNESGNPDTCATCAESECR